MCVKMVWTVYKVFGEGVYVAECDENNGIEHSESEI